MRLKEIKPGMVIHCKNDEEKKMLLEEAERLGYVLYDTQEKHTDDVSVGNTIHFFDKGKKPSLAQYKHIVHSHAIDGTTEFSDLIISDLTAEDALGIFVEICKGHIFCCDCEIGKLDGGSCSDILLNNKEAVIKILEQWKSDHEKKKTENRNS